jgi:hypothetical protein
MKESILNKTKAPKLKIIGTIVTLFLMIVIIGAVGYDTYFNVKLSQV